MSQEPLSAPENTRNAKAIALERVVAFGRQWLAEDPEQLLQHFARQAEQLLQLRAELRTCQAQLQTGQAELQQLQDELHRGSVAPFRRTPEESAKGPPKPGRKPGHPGDWRRSPAPLASDEQIEVPLMACPDCGVALPFSDQRAVEQTILEIPEIHPRVIRLRTYRTECGACQQTVSSTHPLQVSQATGAAGTHLGPRALGLAAALNKDLKLTMRKTCRVLQEMFGLSLSPGGLAQATGRIATALQGAYDESLETLRQSPVIHTDETGWWVGGPGYTLWVFTNPTTTYYRVVEHRDRATAQAILSDTFQGVLVSDCLSIYDGLDGVQQKCYAHHLKALSKALRSEAGQGSSYLLELRTLLHTALLLKRLVPDLDPVQQQRSRDFLETRFAQLLAHPRPLDTSQGQQEEKLRQRLAKQQDHLLTFLDYPEVNATNNHAERQLRPAVISRKLSCGNKTLSGATTWSVLASLAATCQQRGDSFIEQVAQAMVRQNRAA
ncbi:IS66 family transposase [Leptolyngbya iicbica]|uniref:IS66 family transposase n=1 Tax=Lyngbya confervoides BDU141951 TaxID=1574623 RepID=A0A0C1V6S5_9CYAN